MFKKLRNKIKSWTENLSSESEESGEEIESSEEPEEKEKKKKKDKKSEKSSKKEKKKSKNKGEEELEKAQKSIEEANKRKKGKEKQDKEIPLPTKFDAGKQKYEPDLEKIPEKIQEAEEKESDKEKKKNKRFLGLGGKRKVKITEKIFEEYSEDLEMILLENNVALEVSEKIIESLKDEIVGQEFNKKGIEDKIYETMKDTIKEILVDPYDVAEKIKAKSKSKESPYVILFCGVNGTGKTTSIAKISKLLDKKGLGSVLAAGDTFRAASIEQLKKHGSNLGKEVIAGSYGSDPASVGFDAIKYAEKNNIDAVLIDTAGRMYTNKNLMQEIEKVSRVCEPDLKLFVGESTTGNDALEQVKAFNESIGIDGIVLAKADIDEKGGTALSVGYVTGKPILYLGTGQEYKDIEPFDKGKFVEKLFSE